MIKKLRHHGLLIGVILVYVGLILSLLNWGLPSEKRIFTYQMDEWHQLKAVQSVWSGGSNNVAGAAHGPMLNFLISGVYLAVFILIGWIKPELITSAVTGLMMQRRMFQVLRISTLMWGIGAIMAAYFILKKYLKVKQPIWGILLLVFSPVWLISSNYFKYDIALVFWISLALFLMLRYAQQPSKINYVKTGIVTGLAVATKISALPLGLLYVATYFIFSKNWRRDWRGLYWGLSVGFLSFVFLGIPDGLLNRVDWGSYKEFFESNLISHPQQTVNQALVLPWWLHLLLVTLPKNLGYGLSILFVGVIARLKKGGDKYGWWLLMGWLIFCFSLWPLKLTAGGNRSLVLLPFMVLLVGYGMERVKNRLVKGLMVGLIISQIVSGLIALRPKWQKDPRQKASAWMETNIPKGTIIGLENVPIYQKIPDILLKDFYEQEYGVVEGRYEYERVTAKVENLPEVVVVTNKNDLVNRLGQEGYKEEVSFTTKSLEVSQIPEVISVFVK